MIVGIIVAQRLSNRKPGAYLPCQPSSCTYVDSGGDCRCLLTITPPSSHYHIITGPAETLVVALDLGYIIISRVKKRKLIPVDGTEYILYILSSPFPFSAIPENEEAPGG